MLFFFFNDTATTEIYTLSLHDALPISKFAPGRWEAIANCDNLFAQGYVTVNTQDGRAVLVPAFRTFRDRKSTRLNSSHQIISYAVFCLKKTSINTLHLSTPHLQTYTRT